MSRPLVSRTGVLALSAATWLSVATLLRAGLLAYSWDDVGHHAGGVAEAFLVGFVYDVAAFAYLAIPLVLYLTFVPDRWWTSRAHRVVATVLWAAWCYALLLSATVEWAFWAEFGSRFNFIAVDYLVYTKEVAGNIRESYPVGIILPALLVPAALLFVTTRERLQTLLVTATPMRRRLRGAAVALALPAVAWAGLGDRLAEVSGNRYVNELARDGTYSLFAAFLNNRLDYGSFYATRPDAEVAADLRRLVGEDGARFATPDGFDLLRHVRHDGPEKRLNVVVITVESLSARFLSTFGDVRGSHGLTPRLDEVARTGLLLRDYYATGVRTVRGLEALTLSVPPTPGQSVVKRPGNDGMFSLGAPFRERGYDIAFCYGGYGLFDNMNAFYAGNGFRIVDRSDLAADEITFANVWGVCDEDLFARTLKECDASHAKGEPFLRFVMTTSNHRPFTYPAGRIDIPSGDGRDGAVKYTDWAIGRFLDEARKRPWFDDTIFVIGADHCESARGNTDLPVDKFHIPLVFWSPKHVAPREVSGVCSQVDMAPTLLGLLGWSYDSRFFGEDVLVRVPGRAFLCNYLALGLYDGSRLTTLGTHRSVRTELVGTGQRRRARIPDGDAAAASMQDDAIAWFQGASRILDGGLHAALPAGPPQK